MFSKLTKIDQRIAFLAMSQNFTFLQVMIPLIFIGLHTVNTNVVFRITLFFKNSNIAHFSIVVYCLLISLEVTRLHRLLINRLSTIR